VRYTRAISCGLLVTLALLITLAPLGAAPKRRMELVSRLGRRATVKIYSGESLTFRARETRGGLSGIFDSGDFLRGVSFCLREWPRVKQDAHATVKGRNRSVVREKRPEPDLWGLPASNFTVEDERPGRYVLTAKKAGYQSAEVVIDSASFSILVNDGSLSDRHYNANFDVRLVDPSERGKAVPILIESMDAEGAVVDSRSDLRLAPVAGRTALYKTPVGVNLSSATFESFRERVKRKKKDPLPPRFFVTKPMRVVEGGSIRISLRNLHAVYPLPLGY